MEVIEFFNADEQVILEDLNKHAIEYLSGMIEMTPIQEEVMKKYIFLKSMTDIDDADQAPFLFGIIIPNPRRFVKQQAAICKRFHFNADRRPRLFPIPPLLYHTLNLL